MPKNPSQPASSWKPTPFETATPVVLNMTDDALVTIDFTRPVAPDGFAFHDVGYMPVNAVTIAGKMFNSPGGGMDRMFIHYVADGVQHFIPGDTAHPPIPTAAEYTSLHYELIGYNGAATFGRAADGTPTITGPGALHQVLIAQGDLLAGTGHLGFGIDGSISGVVNTSVMVNGQNVGELDITVTHPRGDIVVTQTPTSLGISLSGGDLKATFVPSSHG